MASHARMQSAVAKYGNKSPTRERREMRMRQRQSSVRRRLRISPETARKARSGPPLASGGAPTAQRRKRRGRRPPHSSGPSDDDDNNQKQQRCEHPGEPAEPPTRERSQRASYMARASTTMMSRRRLQMRANAVYTEAYRTTRGGRGPPVVHQTRPQSRGAPARNSSRVPLVGGGNETDCFASKEEWLIAAHSPSKRRSTSVKPSFLASLPL